jgi:hypothetical protein
LIMEYPKHLYEKIREEVAVSYLKHELRKIFPSIKTEEVDSLMNNKELSTPRDFWNGVHGIGMGFKLHIGMIYLITAENIKWTKEKTKVEDLFFGVERENTKLANSRSAKILIEYFQKNPKNGNNNWRDDKIREFDPIIVVEKKEGLTVYDGNGRLDRFILEKRNEIEAYVGRYSTETKKPNNYWLPTSVLMDVLYYVYLAIDNKDEKLFEQQIAVLKNMLSYSESGRYEFKERALTKKPEYRDKVLKALNF